MPTLEEEESLAAGPAASHFRRVTLIPGQSKGRIEQTPGQLSLDTMS